MFAPSINDITTDPSNPPVFVAVAELPANRGRNLAFAPELAPIIRAAYPDLAPLHLAVPAPVALRAAESVAAAMRWKVVGVDAATGRLEAVATTAVFRFRDDVVVRVSDSSDGLGCVVDVRSKSRIGRGDLGANAARIRRFLAALTLAVAPPSSAGHAD